MIVKKGTNFLEVISWTWHHLLWLIVFMSSVGSLYYFKIIEFSIPWLPVSIIGTAVAFYVGFKNNQSYDRLWEARKLWGSIVNTSRMWGIQVQSFITNQFTGEKIPADKLNEIKKRLIYRQIGWLYALRSQLLVPMPWEHIGQKGLTGKSAHRFKRKFGVGLVDDEITRTELDLFLPKLEHDRLIANVNTAAQIIKEQANDLTELRTIGAIEDFRHMEMTHTLNSFFDHQGGCERIKRFPLPRQYANMSRIFIGIFIFLLPFSMIPELMKLGELSFLLSIPISTLIAWVYVMMEIAGDYSENPFQGLANDIPMLSICRSIEIDLREMLNEKKLPHAIEPKAGILM